MVVNSGYPLVMTNSLLLNMVHLVLVSFPGYEMVICHSYVNVYQKVGCYNLPRSHDDIMLAKQSTILHITIPTRRWSKTTVFPQKMGISEFLPFCGESWGYNNGDNADITVIELRYSRGYEDIDTTGPTIRYA